MRTIPRAWRRVAGALALSALVTVAAAPPAGASSSNTVADTLAAHRTHQAGGAAIAVGDMPAGAIEAVRTVAGGSGMTLASTSSTCSYFDLSGTDVADSDYWYQHVDYFAQKERGGTYFANARTVPGDNAAQIEIGAQVDNVGTSSVDGYTDVGMAFEVIPGGSGASGPFRWQIDFGWQLNGRSAARAENIGGTLLGTRLPFIPDNDAEGETRGSVYPTYANLTTQQVFTVPSQGRTLHGARAGTELPYSDVSNNENFAGTASIVADFGYYEPVALLMTLDHFSNALAGATSGGSASSISDFFDPNANISLHVAWMRVTSLSGLQFAC